MEAIIPIALLTSLILGALIAFTFFGNYFRNRKSQVASLAVPADTATSNSKNSKAQQNKKPQFKAHHHHSHADKDSNKRHHPLDLNTLKDHGNAVSGISFSSDGHSLATENGKIKGSLTGSSIGKVTRTQKIWRISQALGAIAFAYSYSLVLIEIQNIQAAIKSRPAEHKTMKRATLISIATTTLFYIFCGCFGYAVLTGFGFYNHYWLFDIANGAIFIHLIGAYQVYCKPLFAFVECTAAKYFPESKFINNNIEIPIPFGGYKPYKLNMLRLVWRTAFVCITKILAMLMPFFNDVVGILGAFGFWPLTVYFPIKKYIIQKKIPKWSTRWILLQIMSIVCLIISFFAAVESFAGLVTDLKVYKPFKTMYR